MPPDTMFDPDEEIVLVGVEKTGTELDITQTIYIKDSGITN
jgi:hypothetical protein